jgi:CheY-like chemotaxis protein
VVVDNEPDALTAMRSLLQPWGWSVHGAGTLEDALAAPWTPDLLLLDYHLDGGVTGLDALQALRLRFGSVPAVVLTADRDPGLRHTVLETGAVMLYKPLKPLALRQVLKHLVMASRPSAATQN